MEKSDKKRSKYMTFIKFFFSVELCSQTGKVPTVSEDLPKIRDTNFKSCWSDAIQSNQDERYTTLKSYKIITISDQTTTKPNNIITISDQTTTKSNKIITISDLTTTKTTKPLDLETLVNGLI